jgi:hypothetical protein
MHAIADRVRELADLYPVALDFEDEPHETLYKQIQHDWSLFDDSFSTADCFPDFIDTLLRAGLDNDEAYEMRSARELVKPIEPTLLYFFQDKLGENLFRGKFWEHFILPDGPPVSWYDAFLEDMRREIPQDQALYRARVWDRNLEEHRFSRTEMGAPPAESISPGRANRRCQRTLYCAGDVETSIVEVRPYKGSGVAVSKVNLARNVRIIDFASCVSIGSPLLEDNLGWRIQTRQLLEHIAYLFSLPANPSAQELYYAPTQSLCDSLREAGYDGIQYRSSLKEGGINYALFTSDLGILEDPAYYWIEDISIRYSNAEPFEPEHPYLYEYRRSYP